MLDDFKAFVVRGNVVDLAVGIVMGASFGAIVTSLVNDILMPPIGRLLGRVDFTNFFVSLSGQSYPTLAAARAAGVPSLRSQRTMQTHHIALAEKAVEVDHSDVGLGFLARTRNAGDDAHPEGRRQSGDGLPDAPVADDAEGEPGQFGQRALPVTPVLRAHPAT